MCLCTFYVISFPGKVDVWVDSPCDLDVVATGGCWVSLVGLLHLVSLYSLDRHSVSQSLFSSLSLTPFVFGGKGLFENFLVV